MGYKKIEAGIKICAERLGELADGGPDASEFESHLVARLVVLIVSEYEELIEGAFVKRAEACGDEAIANYVRSIIARKFRSPDITKITETLAHFGGDYKKSFSEAVLNTEPHAAWDNIMRARHAVVHKSGALNLTLRELKDSYPKTKKVISVLENVLGVQIVD